METVEQRLNKLREERIAREKARIDKLRELNLKKYNNNDAQSISKTPSTLSLANKTLKTDSKPKFDLHKSNLKCSSNQLKYNSLVNGPKRPITGLPPSTQSKLATRKENPIQKSVSEVKNAHNSLKPEKPVAEVKNLQKVPVKNIKHTEKKDFINSNKIITKPVNKDKQPMNAPKTTLSRKSFAPIKLTSQPKLLESQSKLPEKKEGPRKSMLPVRPVSVTKNRESVFDRLYKPKTVQKAQISDADRLQRDPLFLQKVLQQGSLIANKRHTIFANASKPVVARPVRRSISAVHFKRISKKELGNCFQKWSSIGEKLNEVDITNTNEDDRVKQDTITSAVKSERKRVRLQTPISFTPRPEELQSRLQNWLKSRGKSIDSYQHLQCFGIHHLAQKPMRPLFLKPANEPLFLKPANEPEYDDENKENIALEHDSDNDSYTENLNEQTFDDKKWRGRVSYISDSVCMNDSDHDTTLNSDETPVDDVLLGALKDLTDLLREGYDWEQCARWLRGIRSRFPHAPSLAAYWECRAALEDTRGDLPASVQCWEQAIATGTQHSVVEANLDLLLDKFMQLKISPNGGARAADPKLLDVRNVFKSTIIRFAVQQAKLRQSNQSEQPTYIMTPVRRSGRISSRWSTKTQRSPIPKTPKTPLQICSSVRQAGLMGEKVLFVPNATLCNTP